MNASAAPMALVGLGAFATIRWFGGRDRSNTLAVAGAALIAWSASPGFSATRCRTRRPWAIFARMMVLGVLLLVRALRQGCMPAALATGLAALLVFGSLGWLLYDGVDRRWVSESNQWAEQGVRTSLAAARQVVDAAGERPIVLVGELRRHATRSSTTNTGYGWAKTYTNVFRTGLPGDAIERATTYFGTLDNFMAGEPTTSTQGSQGYDDTSISHWCETFGGPDEDCDPDEKKPDDFVPRLEEYHEDPVVFLFGQYYGGLVQRRSRTAPPTRRAAGLRGKRRPVAVEVGPDVYVIEGEGLWSRTADVVDRAARRRRGRGAEVPGSPRSTRQPAAEPAGDRSCSASC